MFLVCDSNFVTSGVYITTNNNIEYNNIKRGNLYTKCDKMTVCLVKDV